MPALYLVATPIGNLEDITLRAIRILKEVKLIAAEDTRKTRTLLSAYNINTPTTSYHEHNKLTKLDFILDRLATDDVALVSDAGMPGISDPGYELIAAVNRHNIPIVPVPGPSALVSALVASGLPSDKFLFLGFLPHKKGDRRKTLTANLAVKSTLIFFESPHRVLVTLQDILEILGDRLVAVCRELTKIHEEIFRGTISQAIQHYTAPRGEFTLVVAGASLESDSSIDKFVESDLARMQQSGVTAREAIAQISAGTGIPRKELYRTWLKIK